MPRIADNLTMISLFYQHRILQIFKPTFNGLERIYSAEETGENFLQQKYIFETKIWEGNKYYQAGKKQLAACVKSEVATEG